MLSVTRKEGLVHIVQDYKTSKCWVEDRYSVTISI